MVIRGIVAAVAAALLAGPGLVLAKGAGASAGAGVGMGAGSAHAGVNLNSNGPNSLDRDKGLDRAGDRRSVQGNLNANSPGSRDRDKGLARAEDRHEMHSSATVATTRDARMADAYAKWQAQNK